ncbi:hypothetical protein WUBG_04183 [Wuchereria bancrofti]|uniref:Uncharacterized protein n=1 Tax=Wuchereria bancrofti TaxID=6293 RepID=J9BCI8_WUCBA|nr:hypothetical protein WUBG_04183 [Wuchereria bancrofti]
MLYNKQNILQAARARRIAKLSTTATTTTTATITTQSEVTGSSFVVENEKKFDLAKFILENFMEN